MCVMQTERDDIARRILGWLRDRCPLWQRLREVDEDEVAAMGLDEPSSPERQAWVTQVVEESKIAEGNLIYIVDQSDHWRTVSKRPFPHALAGWRYVMDEYPDYEIRDVHITYNSIHIYIRRRNG